MSFPGRHLFFRATRGFTRLALVSIALGTGVIVGGADGWITNAASEGNSVSIPVDTPRVADHIDPSRIVVARTTVSAPDVLDELHLSLGGERVSTIPAIFIEVVEFPRSGADASLQDRLGAYSAHPEVRWVEADTIVTVGEPHRTGSAGEGPRMDHGARILSPDVVPDDPRYAEQWGLDTIGMPRAWDVGKADGAVIAIVDTGVDCTHPDLAAACVEGYDVVDDDDDPMDEHRHGTIEAGVAAAVTNNAIGISGVAWGAKIMPVRAMGADGTGSGADIAEAIVWAADHDADVINMSLGSKGEISAVTDAVRHARAAGATMAAAAGNSGAREPHWPAANAEVMGIAATTRADTRASFSTQGDHVFVAAPGWQLLTTDLGGTYNLYDGTSEATAFVSGFAALLIAQDPTRTPDDVEKIIRDTALDLGPAGWDEHFGWGRIDVGAGMAGPSDPGPGPVPPAGGTCETRYRLELHAFPDTVGSSGQACQGCDGIYSSGDRMAAAWCGIEPARVRVTAGNDPTNVLWEGDLAVSRLGDARASITLCVPPPWNVEMVSGGTGCLTLCPNTPALRALEQADVDGMSGTRRGAGRVAEVRWSFSKCPEFRWIGKVKKGGG